MTADNKLKNLNKKVTSNKAKHVLVENESHELSEKVELISTKGLTKDRKNKYWILIGEKYFSSDVLQNHLAFKSFNKYIEFFSKTGKIYSWKSKGMSEEIIKNPPGSENTSVPSLIDNRPLTLAKTA